MSVAITGISAVSCLGNTLSEHADNMSSGISGLKPLSNLFGDSSPYAQLSAGWIEDRSLLNSRKWAPGSALSLHVAKEAILDAGLTHHDLSQAAIFVGSSRGNIAGWISPWPGRRPFKLMAASNSMHGELASAISIELGITGPWQVIASGCAASLDALGMAWLMIKQGIVKHAIVTGVELPLTPTVLDMYTNTGVLSTNGVNDPYSQSTSGFFPGEAGAAIVLESIDSLHERRLAVESTYPGGHLTSSSTPESIASSYLQMTGYWCNSDAASPIGMPTDGAGLRDCLHHALSDLCDDPHLSSPPTHPPIHPVITGRPMSPPPSAAQRPNPSSQSPSSLLSPPSRPPELGGAANRTMVCAGADTSSQTP